MDKKKSLLRVKLLQSKNIKVETKNDIKKEDKIFGGVYRCFHFGGDFCFVGFFFGVLRVL